MVRSWSEEYTEYDHKITTVYSLIATWYAQDNQQSKRHRNVDCHLPSAAITNISKSQGYAMTWNLVKPGMGLGHVCTYNHM